MFLKKKIIYNNFTSIIPAAGKSSRFKNKTNKLLYKINNKILLQHVVDKIKNKSKKVIIICNTKNLRHIKKEVKLKKSIFIVQKIINGMATAIQKSFPEIKTENCLIIWGDQLGIKSKTIDLTIKSHLKNNSKITFPIVYNSNPYTLVNFTKKGIFKNIKQSREENLKVKKGYSDCGFFCCNSNFLISNLNKCIKRKINRTKITKEYDFLKALKYFRPKNKIKFIVSKNKKDYVGINYLDDISKV